MTFQSSLKNYLTNSAGLLQVMMIIFFYKLEDFVLMCWEFSLSVMRESCNMLIFLCKIWLKIGMSIINRVRNVGYIMDLEKKFGVLRGEFRKRFENYKLTLEYNRLHERKMTKRFM